MTDDGRIGEQPLDVGGAKTGHDLRVEVGKSSPETFSFSQYRQPRQPTLKTFQAQLLKNTVLLPHRPAPFVVVIKPVLSRRIPPPTPLEAVVASHGTLLNRHHGWAPFSPPCRVEPPLLAQPLVYQAPRERARPQR